VLLATLHNGGLDGHIACQGIYIHGASDLEGLGCRCIREFFFHLGLILELLHRNDTPSHQCADPDEEKEQK
jgi:hypothetical protein